MDDLIIHWDELADYKDRGLQVLDVEQGPDGETRITAEMPDEMRQEIAGVQAKKPGRGHVSIQDVMKGVTGRAQANPGKVQRARLSGGLGIDVIYGIDGECRMQIWREGKEPAMKEWWIVLAAWEGAPADVKPEKFSHLGKGFLRGGWAQPTERTEA
jgi:hypothetical protein